MKMKFHLLFFMSYFLLDEFAHSFQNCFPDEEQKCGKQASIAEWPKSKMRFLLFTRKNPKVPEMLHLCNGTLPLNSNFNPNNQLVVFIPGFMFGTCELEVVPELKDDFLEKEDMNVILIVNVEEFGSEYISAMEKTERAANITVQVLRNIQEKTGLKNEKVYLIGHSLGTQVAGQIGQQFKVRRITALDPAGVLYSKDTPIENRIDPSDADIVDVIHTNGGTGLPYLGAYFPMGDVDIYVNGGSNQPSCSKSAWTAAGNFNFLFMFGVYSVPCVCAHFQAVEYYKLSIKAPDKFIAYACKNYKTFKSGNCTGDGALTVAMGYNFEESYTPEHQRKEFPRKYYIDTKDTWPFY